MPSYVVSIIVSAALGILLGWLAVLALKSAARALGCLVVVLFIAVQILGYYGLVEWDWAAFFEHLNQFAGIAVIFHRFFRMVIAFRSGPPYVRVQGKVCRGKIIPTVSVFHTEIKSTFFASVVAANTVF